ncbi:SatD family protein [Microbacterium sp. cx-59]|uniref:SatD family protein n=1 Tax=Microbacterium sp. cx-59 TaxID=2891207 RepID=UPI001E59EE76|nr:SatD family protein [Microbacterium sp. cx-59]MCC4909802.1 SatD family protein [Microbacterium sp. cx-59]
MSVAVIADIVGSRRLVDREAGQRAVEQAVARATADLPGAERMLTPTVGDELQGVYADLGVALGAVLLVRLALPDGVDCRFGIGIGATGTIASEAVGTIAEGPGWWAAREAIDTVHGLQGRTVSGARTWVAASAEANDRMRETVRIANAGLLTRDHLVTAMSARARRLTYGRCIGTPQRALAASEGVTQSAVSQLLASSGANAIVEGFRWVGETD